MTTAGIAAIQAVGALDGVQVTAPAPAAVGAQFTPERTSTQYRAVVFLNTGMASPLTDPQRANFEAYYRKGGGFVGIGSAIETDASWPFMTGLLGARSSGSHRSSRPSRSPTASMTRARTSRSTGSAPSPITTSTRTSAASRTC